MRGGLFIFERRLIDDWGPASGAIVAVNEANIQTDYRPLSRQ